MAPPTTAARRALDAAIEAHRIYFEVERETSQQGEQRVTIALRVWLWATIPRRAGSLPGEPGCRAAVAALHDAADAAIARARLDPAPDVEPFRWALYASRQVPEADEIRLGVNVRGPPGDGPEATPREDALRRFRQALEDVGVFEGSWKPSLGAAGAAEGPLAAPAPRAAGEALVGRLVPAHA